MSFFMIGANKKLKESNKLLILLKLIDWKKCEKLLRNVHKNDINPQGGQKAYDNIKMFKVMLLQQWHSLSDEQTEEAVKRKVQAQFTFKAICSNLLKAANKLLAGKFKPIYAIRKSGKNQPDFLIA